MKFLGAGYSFFCNRWIANGGNLNPCHSDINGNLSAVTDRAFATTDFTYNADHGLIDIIDPLGRRVVRNIYDNDGRLQAQEDSDGNRTEYAHNLV